MPTTAILGTRVNDAVSVTGWGNDGGGGGVAAEPDIVYTGTAAQSRKVSTSPIGRNYTHGSGTSVNTVNQSHWLAKVNATNSNALEARTTPALLVKYGSASGSYYSYYLFGTDNYPPRGGWQLVPISPRVVGYRNTVTGAPNIDSVLYWSIVGDFTGSSKGENLVIDAIDLTRGWEISSTAANFASLLTADEGTASARYGHIFASGPIINVNGLIAIGRSGGSTASVTFSDTSGGTMVWGNGLAETGYHKLLIDLATTGTTVDMAKWNLLSTGKKNNDANRGYATGEDTRTQLEVVGSAATGTTQIVGGSFQNFSKVTLSSKLQLTGVSLECEEMLQNSADVEECEIITTSEPNRATLQDPVFGTTTDLNNTQFVQGGTGHALRLDAGLGLETAAAFQAVTALTATTTANAVAWPTHAANDVAFLCVETRAGDIPLLSTPAGFTFIRTIAARDASTRTRLSIWWKRATSSSEATPTIISTDNHSAAYMITFRGVATTGLPWADFAMTTTEAVASTTVTHPSVTSKANGQLIFGVATAGASAVSAWGSGHANAGLTSITERADAGSTTDSGALNLWTAVDSVQGSTGSTTFTDTNSRVHTQATFAMRGVASTQARGNYQAAQTLQSGTGAVAVSWPTHVTNDVAFLIAETNFDETPTLSTPAGFTLVGTQATTTGTGATRCTVWWHRATSAAMSAPTIADAGDHVIATIVTMRGCRTTGNPWDAFSQGANDTASTSHSFTAPATLYANQRTLAIATHGISTASAQFSVYNNPTMDDETERFDASAVAGGGGGIGVFTATDPTAGAGTASEVTLASSTKGAFFHFAIAAKEAEYTLTGLTGLNTSGGYGIDGELGSVPAYRASSITNHTTADTGPLVANVPTSSEDDILLIFIDQNSANDTGTITATGWTQIDSPFDGDAMSWAFWKRATSSEPATYSFSGFNNSAMRRCVMASYAGCVKTGNPIGPFIRETGARSFDSSPITIGSGQLLVLAGSSLDTITQTWSSSFGNPVERVDSYDATVDMLVALYDELPGAGTHVRFIGHTVGSALKNVTVLSLLPQPSAAIHIPDQGGQYVINVSGGSTPTVVSTGAGFRVVNTVNVTLENLIVGSEVLIYETANPSNVIMSRNAASSTETVAYNYLGNLGISIRVRKSSAAVKYLPYMATGTILNTGFTLAVAQQRDSIALL